jgi:hypothetical protein
MTDRAFWISVREALLLLVSAIEKMLDIRPSTAECRKRAKGKS